MANVQAVAESFLEMYGSVDGIKANVPSVNEEIIAAAQKILDSNNAAALPKKFIEIISAQLTHAEKAEIGAYCQKTGCDGPMLFRIYRVFKALQS